MNKVLELKNISRTYYIREAPIRVFENININIDKKEKLALVGPSGCGKTSLLNIAGLLERPNKGEVLLNGLEIEWISDKKMSEYRKKNIGFVFQFNNLLSDFTVIENVALPLIIDGYSRKESIKRANDLLTQVGLSNRAGNYPNQVSGGEQQRVAIARALVNNPSLIIADEPTGNLDQKTAMNIVELFNKLVDEFDCSLFLATHNIEIANLQDNVLNMEGLN
ncbi:MAG: ABC transporter [Rhodobiaceae bacterium]|jgi:ABC-type lipoprotein export system ATPase subunit|nr:ABC transporter [Rhodobiaceae bacterium]|tara:strand:+ start:20293 stop:20958 length:666 start_codon:yes stop_codon:yes gene_type:complete